MKNLSLLMLLMAAALSSCTKETIRGAGAVITQDRIVPAFTGVQVNGDGEAVISYGAVQKVSITGYENLVPIYEATMVGSILHLQFKPNQYRVRNNNIRVNIVVPQIATALTNGSGYIAVKNFEDGDELDASVNGSGDLVIADNKYNKVKYSINGSGNIDANTTTALSAVASIHGSGYIGLRTLDRIDANISGSGTIDYWGNPGIANTEVSGSGKINKK